MSTAVQEFQNKRRGTLRSLFAQQKPELMKLLPKGMDPERLFRMALTECAKNGDLLKCTPESWALAIQTCAQQGLYPDSGLGYMYLVPRNNKKKGAKEVSAMRGYQGDIKLMRNSGEIESVWAEVVYQKDEYKVTKGLDRNIVHVPSDEADPGPLVACYAAAKLVSGEIAFVTLNKRDVDRHRASSDSAHSEYSPWMKHEAAMWKKTAIHELAKWVPKSTEKAERAMAQIIDTSATVIDTTAADEALLPAPAKTGLEGLTMQLQEETEAEKPAGREPGSDDDAPDESPKGCPHPSLPNARIAAIPEGKSIACPDCGQDLTAKDAEPMQPAATPTEDPRAAVEAVAKAAEGGKGKQRTILQ